jgi:hypothetical protein
MELRLTCVVLLLTVIASAAPAPQTNKPVKVIQVDIDGGPPEPKTLEALFRLAPLVIEGTVDSLTPVDRNIDLRDSNRFAVMVQTSYRVRITEVYKATSTSKVPAVVDVVLPIGTRDRGDRIEQTVTDRIHTLATGESFILFLMPTDDRSAYRLATIGDSSVVEIKGDRASAREPKSAVAAAVRSGDAAQLRRTLRARGRGGRP